MTSYHADYLLIQCTPCRGGILISAPACCDFFLLYSAPCRQRRRMSIETTRKVVFAFCLPVSFQKDAVETGVIRSFYVPEAHISKCFCRRRAVAISGPKKVSVSRAYTFQCSSYCILPASKALRTAPDKQEVHE
jgi:hypothetical protein